ncbi:MAG: DUF4093 domain-containing protein [Oscillospiraceae bacterium]|nr:DUF4093 domain-containing protein [Oscillospiraceae bacterium]
MEKMKVREVIVVEGKYDLNTLKQMIDGVIVTTDGFGIFHNSEKMELIRRMAEKRGVVVLTDSDGAGFVIRNHLKSCLPKEQVKHAYIPDIHGKEKRKRIHSKEGKLGVEGMSRDVICRALTAAGVTIDDETLVGGGTLTKADLYAVGLSGTSNSAENRMMLIRALELPERLSPNALLDVLNAMYGKQQFLDLWMQIQNKQQS